MKQAISRRDFLQTGAQAVAAFTIVPGHVLGGTSFISPSDQITLGFIGTGRQAKGALLPQFVKRARVEALCDVDAKKLDDFRMTAESLYEKQGQKAKGIKLYSDFRELLENKSIDAVVIATPDHWHAIHVMESVKAKKDVYCEKPFSHSISEGRFMTGAVNKYGRICQVGSMQRSWHNFWHASQLVQSGLLGEIRLVRVNTGDENSVFFPKPCDLPSQPCPEYLDWDFWIGPARYRDYNEILSPPLGKNVWAMWRSYRDFGSGNMGDWGAHMFDLVQWALGKDDSGPLSVTPSGKKYEHLTYVYDNGIRVLFEDFHRGRGVQFIGSEGELTITREFYETTPAELSSYSFKANEITVYKSEDHYQNWLDCIKSRKQPVATAEIGHRTATVCHLGIIANRLQRVLQWNPKDEKFICDDEANKLISCDMREPWSLPKI